MYSNELSIQYQGFHPSDFAHELFTDKMNELIDEAPTGATLKAVISRKDDMFKGVITIHSAAGRFVAISNSNKIKYLTQKLSAQIKRQLNKWKSQRFEHKSLKDIPLSIDNVSEEFSYESNNAS